MAQIDLEPNFKIRDQNLQNKDLGDLGIIAHTAHTSDLAKAITARSIIRTSTVQLPGILILLQIKYTNNQMTLLWKADDAIRCPSSLFKLTHSHVRERLPYVLISTKVAEIEKGYRIASLLFFSFVGIFSKPYLVIIIYYRLKTKSHIKKSSFCLNIVSMSLLRALGLLSRSIGVSWVPFSRRKWSQNEKERIGITQPPAGLYTTWFYGFYNVCKYVVVKVMKRRVIESALFTLTSLADFVWSTLWSTQCA